MKLHQGQIAPDFKVQDIYGNPVSLADYRGKRVLLSFFRDVSCPFCNLRVRDLSKRREELEKMGLHMILFFESSAEVLNSSLLHKKASPIPLIGDPKKQVYGQYGIEASALKMMKTFFQSGAVSAMKEGATIEVPKTKDKSTMTLIPADFLIDTDQKIHTAHYGAHIRDHITIADLENFIKS
ncbi:Peroxiredoxin [Reichenbachiella agariperforans]|uniref:Peroxiredoxin n=1 Tax=Reichenbachiella agariperforans TaxID=156994 RepID=A0A1M6LI05_REIAG|nr:peroxiredoxin-like family protein [Reichenbachiella agariperforans]SHJ70798.1 Peroxiredoxin [Reichenbachiella agariperforans]